MVIVVACAHAQDWELVDVSFDPPGNYNMSHGIFVDENKGWFAQFYPGQVWKTGDGGRNWELQMERNHVWLHNIDFIDSLHGWVAGETITDRSGFMWRTKDGGESWEEISIPTLAPMTFLDSLTGFAGGDTSIYLTNNGGNSWHAQVIGEWGRTRVTH